jgi:hypothetical protein
MFHSMQKYHVLFISLFILSLMLLFSPSVFAQGCIDNDLDGYGVNDDPSCPNSGIDCDDTDNNDKYRIIPLSCFL